MRFVNGFFCVLLVLFAVVQYNDPDFAIWFSIYGIAAAWAGVAAFRPGVLRAGGTTIGLIACLAAVALGMVYMWPSEPGWWRQDVWWNNELVREGIGLMIILVALLMVALTRRLAGTDGPDPDAGRSA